MHHDGSVSTIDLVFMSDNIIVQSCETLPPLGNSDHYGLLTNLILAGRNCTHIQPYKGHLIWSYDDANWITGCNLIQYFDINSILFDIIEQTWNSCHRISMSIMERTIPSSKIKTHCSLSWLNKSIIQLMRRTNKLFKQAKHTGDFMKYKLGCSQRDLGEIAFSQEVVKSVPTLNNGSDVACTNGDKAIMLLQTVLTLLSPHTLTTHHLLDCQIQLTVTSDIQVAHRYAC